MNQHLNDGKLKAIMENGTLAYSVVDHYGKLSVYLVRTKISNAYYLHAFYQTDHNRIDKSFKSLEDIFNLSKGDSLFRYKKALVDVWEKRAELVS